MAVYNIHISMRWHIHRVPLGNCTHHVFRLHEGKWATEGGGRPNCSDVLRSLDMQFATCVYMCICREKGDGNQNDMATAFKRKQKSKRIYALVELSQTLTKVGLYIGPFHARKGSLIRHWRGQQAQNWTLADGYKTVVIWPTGSTKVHGYICR